jgi:hypothetical protein
MNAVLSGTVSDSSAATVPGATLTLTSQETRAVANFTTGTDGLYTFGNLPVGTYDLKVTAKGFRTYVQTSIKLHLGDTLRQDISLQVGTQVQEIQVLASPSPLNYENAEHKEGVDPEIIGELPLLVAGSIRTVSSFVSLLPGVSPGGWYARVNGAQQESGAVIFDGASMLNPTGTNGIMADLSDFPQSPDDIGEFKALTSNYSPQYGESHGASVLMSIRSGTDKFHGSLYEFLRNTDLNARQFGIDERPKDIENEFGARIGGPVKLPLAWSGRNKTYFFFNYEQFTLRGSLVRQWMTIPSMQERQGNFSDWVDSNGNLIPVYDPATTQPNPNYNSNLAAGPGNLPYLRNQFMGCDGNTPNVICPSDPRLQNSLALGWFKFLPNPTTSGPVNNYLAPPVPGGWLNAPAYTNTIKIDEYIGNKDHISASAYFKYVYPENSSALPDPISNTLVVWNRNLLERVNYDRTISPTLLNHLVLGYNNNGAYWEGADTPYGNQLPQIPGVTTHAFPPSVSFSSGFPMFGTSSGAAHNPAPAAILNDTMTWVKGAHTINFGGDYNVASNNLPALMGGESGMFSFSNTETGLLGLPNSGSPIASFLLEQVDSGSAVFKSVQDTYTRWHQGALFFADTWKATHKLSVDYGVRWEEDLPTYELHNNFSFLDPTEPNPGAGNLPGALAFAGSGLGRCNCSRPEIPWHKGFAPRLAFAYSPRANNVVRAGYGLFYDMANMPGWNTSGISQDGYNTTPTFSSTEAGMVAAFILNQGLPQNFQKPPFIDPSFDNGQGGPYYRPANGNRLPYSQQWNLTLDHQFTNNFYVSVAYVGSKGTRLLSEEAAINTLNPKYLSMGNQLYDLFQPGQTQVDGVPIPFASFATTMQACAPSVAQALLPHPQYCSAFFGLDENAGNSTYHSFQVKGEHRFANNFWFLGSYTLSKSITDSDDTQPSSGWIFSPFQRHRNKSLAWGDVPQVLVASFVYGLPLGNGKRWLSGRGPLSKVVSNWTMSQVFRTNSGSPYVIHSSACTIPGQFAESCVPGLLPGMSPFAQPEKGVNLNKPLLNVNAFESANSFNFYQGQGPRVENFRGQGYTNQDIALERRIALKEGLTLLLRAESFNTWNWHSFGNGFVTDVADPGFGTWNGSVSNPRNIQLSGRITF